MDEMKIKLRTKFMREMIGKIIAKAINKQIGGAPEIHIESLELENIDHKIHFKVNLDGCINDSVLYKINHIIDTE